MNDCVLVAADNGDRSVVVGTRLRLSRVRDRDVVRKRGIFSPMTESGDILVGGVLASAYTMVENEPMQRALFVTQRALTGQKSSDGIVVGENEVR